MVNGISIVICCYNSAQRLPETLAHLAAQAIPSTVPWEIIIIDNASTDNTADVARASWLSTSSAPLHIIHEPQQGLSYARLRGFCESTYDVISFVDDDNWVCPEWVQTVSEIMTQHPHVGACGGCSEAVLDSP
ncbi:MAG: glycosyltransferase family 2 protein, partial [Phormidesmis sp. CAN_BIN44]|nr:glycosyltransferase family 2 protein [Phormidesmis sp. CAN_BIN44]